MLVYTVKDKKYYMSSEGNFTEDFKQVLPIEYEHVSFGSSFCPKLFRLKCFNKFYITESKTKGISLEEQKSDTNLMNQNWKYISFLNSVMSIGSDMKLSTFHSYDEKNEMNNRQIYPFPDSCLRFDSDLDTKFKELFVNGFCVMDLNLDVRAKDVFERSKLFLNNNYNRQISNLLKIDVCFQKLLCQPEIKKMMTDIYGTDFHLTSFSSSKINKSSDTANFNVSYPYNIITGKIPSKTLGVQVMILLDDFTQENGGHEVQVYTHGRKSIPTKEEIESTQKYTHKIVAKKGSVVFMLGKLWNRECKSNLDTFKTCLTAHFSSFDVSPKDPLKSYFTFQNEGLILKDDKIMFSEQFQQQTPSMFGNFGITAPPPISVPQNNSIVQNLFGNTGITTQTNPFNSMTTTAQPVQSNPFLGTDNNSTTTNPFGNFSIGTSTHTTNNVFKTNWKF